MSVRPEVVHELRSMFKAGATPSRLIRHIVERHENEPGHHALIQAYFLEGFGIPIVRGLNATDDYQPADLRYAFLNEQLVHDMIERRETWDSGPDPAESWFDPPTATDQQHRLRAIQEAPIPELSSWPQLTPKERAFIHRSLATANGLYESVRILARLAETLQQQLTELQAAPAGADRADDLT